LGLASRESSRRRKPAWIEHGKSGRRMDSSVFTSMGISIGCVYIGLPLFR